MIYAKYLLKITPSPFPGTCFFLLFYLFQKMRSRNSRAFFSLLCHCTMRESRSLQKIFFSRFQKNIITFFFSVLENFVTSFFLSFFVSSLKFVGEEMGFTYEIIIKFFCQFRLSCNIYRRNNTTISRDMRERERTRSKFRKFKKFRSYLQNKIKIKKDKNKEIDRERERKKERKNRICFSSSSSFKSNKRKRRCNGGNNEHKRWKKRLTAIEVRIEREREGDIHFFLS